MLIVTAERLDYYVFAVKCIFRYRVVIMTILSTAAHTAAASGLKRKAVCAVFRDRQAARHAIGELRSFGLRADQIGIAMREYHQQQKFIEETGTHAAEGAVGVMVGGGLLRALLAMKIPEAEARRRESSFHRGSVLVAAKVFLGAAEAQSIMDRNGGGVLTQLDEAQLN